MPESDVRSNPIPEFHLQLRFKGKHFNAGILGELKTIRPATQTTPDGVNYYNTNETLTSYALGAYGEYKVQKFKAKAGVTYGQNLSEYFMQGGYAVKSIDEQTGKREYTSSNGISTRSEERCIGIGCATTCR